MLPQGYNPEQWKQITTEQFLQVLEVMAEPEYVSTKTGRYYILFYGQNSAMALPRPIVLVCKERQHQPLEYYISMRTSSREFLGNLWDELME